MALCGRRQGRAHHHAGVAHTRHVAAAAAGDDIDHDADDSTTAVSIPPHCRDLPLPTPHPPPVHQAGDKLEPDKTITEPWRVYVRWVSDSDKFNEWMNPIDYETEESLEAQEAAGTVG